MLRTHYESSMEDMRAFPKLDDWKSIYKKGGKHAVENYHVIIIINTTYRLYAMILEQKINKGRVQYQQCELKWHLDRWVQGVSHSYTVTEIMSHSLGIILNLSFITT